MRVSTDVLEVFNYIGISPQDPSEMFIVGKISYWLLVISITSSQLTPVQSQAPYGAGSYYSPPSSRKLLIPLRSSLTTGQAGQALTNSSSRTIGISG
ncbi:MAG: hypothetical protein IID16_07685 [Candidatus Marinimicrobia bacterium]|nr:hypothetical protein [Candidatus Neomarinimicrobiota bacterium]